MLARLVLASLTIVGSSAFARPSTLDMTCAQAYDLVMSEGAVVLSTHAYTEDQYVAHGGYCANTDNDRAEPAWVPTLDNGQCFVGYTCEESSNR